jgi:hypothetical protein
MKGLSGMDEHYSSEDKRTTTSEMSNKDFQEQMPLGATKSPYEGSFSVAKPLFRNRNVSRALRASLLSLSAKTT